MADDRPFLVPEAIAARGPALADSVRALVEEAELREDREAAAALETALGLVPRPLRGVVRKVLLG